MDKNKDSQEQKNIEIDEMVCSEDFHEALIKALQALNKEPT